MNGYTTLEVVPLPIKQAQAFIDQHHRRHQAPKFFRFAVGLEKDGELVGAAVAGLPLSRNLCDGRTIEITRLCTLGDWNAPSILYGALARAAFALGYTRVLTYTCEDEPGTSLRAAGFRFDGLTRGESWDRPGRNRIDKHPTGPKKRWVKTTKPTKRQGSPVWL